MAALGYAARFTYVTGATFQSRVAIALRIAAHSQYQNNPPVANQEAINEWAKAVLKSKLDVNDPLVTAAVQALVSRNTNAANDDATTDGDLFLDIESAIPAMVYITGYTDVLPQ